MTGGQVIFPSGTYDEVVARAAYKLFVKGGSLNDRTYGEIAREVLNATDYRKVIDALCEIIAVCERSDAAPELKVAEIARRALGG